MPNMFIALLLLALTLIPHPAHAYIDPGSGSLLLQSLIALVVGGWLAFRVFASKLWRKLRRGGSASDRGADQSSDDRDDGAAR